jgi:cysteine-rich repeat protein
LDGIDHEGNSVAHGTVQTTIVVGGTATASVDLATGPSVCGNSVIDLDESCDDGNQFSFDGCDFQCQAESRQPDTGIPGDLAAEGTGDTSGMNLDGGIDQTMPADVARGDAGDTPPPTAQQACRDIATARCSKRSTCSSLPNSTSPGAGLVRVFGDIDTCIARESLVCTNVLSAPQNINSPSGLEACVAQFPTYSCQDFFDNNPPAACNIMGMLANTATCAFDSQCASGYCQVRKNSACGTCADAPLSGADCSSSSCGHNQCCVLSTRACETVVPLNGAFDSSRPCDSGLACFGDTKTAAGTCLTAGTSVGTSCGSASAMPGCESSLGLYCAGPVGAKTCTMFAFVGAGQPCGVLADGTHAVCIAGDCYTSSGHAGTGDLGTCKADALETSTDPSCDTVLGPGRLSPARCVLSGVGTAGTCIVPTAAMCPS